jgi:hypothetical protein
MAIKFFRSIDITGNEIQNVKLHNIGSITAGASNLGQVYFDTSTGDKKVKVNSDYASEGTFVMEPLAFETWVTANFNNYSLPVASSSNLGGIKIGYSESNKNYPVELDGSNKAYVNVPWTDTSALTTEQVQDIVGDMVDGGTETRIAVSYDDSSGKLGFVVDDMNYTLPLSASGTRGGVQIGYSTNAGARNYAVQLDSEKMYVNVPWTDNNDDVSNANLLTALAALESAGGTANQNITIGTDPGDTIVITGNLTVSGTTTTLNTETVTIEDNIIVLNNNASGSATADAGIEIERGDDTNVSLFWDESEDAWTITNASGTYQILQSIGGTSFKVDLDATGEASVSKTSNTYTVTHNLGTKDVIIQVVDISDGTPTYETVFTENQRPTVNTVTVAFASSVADDDYRVLISQV